MRTHFDIAKVHSHFPTPLSRALREVALILLLSLFCALTFLVLTDDFPVVASVYFIEQDSWWLMLAILFGWLLPLIRYRDALVQPTRHLLERPRLSLIFMTSIVFAITFAGTYVVHNNFNLTNDEVMASFDAEIFRTGRPLALLPEEWRPFGPALLPVFGFPLPDHAGWMSAYLPGNAAYRAVIDHVALPQMANPLLAAVAIVAIYNISRQFWPGRSDAAIMSALLLATSTQFLTMTTTSFAMTGHLALNLLWLCLFLRNDKTGHFGALAIGFLACGWHQLIFHPLFATPFVLSLWWERRWGLALTYSLSYSVSALFWINYWQFAALWSEVALGGSSASGLKHLWQTVLALLNRDSGHDLALMGLNLLRFLAWQNPLMLPLVLICLRSARQCPSPLRLAGAGFCLAIVVVFILLPEQGQGWGYRYLHGFIGVMCLLAAQGWISLNPTNLTGGEKVWLAPAMACVVVLLVQLPGQAFQIRARIDPFVRAVAAIQSLPVDIVVVDRRGMVYSHRLVRNDPFLRNRPLILWLPSLTERHIGTLCSRANRIRVFDQRSGKKYGLPTFDIEAQSSSADEDEARYLLRSLACVSTEVL